VELGKGQMSKELEPRTGLIPRMDLAVRCTRRPSRSSHARLYTASAFLPVSRRTRRRCPRRRAPLPLRLPRGWSPRAGDRPCTQAATCCWCGGRPVVPPVPGSLSPALPGTSLRQGLRRHRTRRPSSPRGVSSPPPRASAPLGAKAHLWAGDRQEASAHHSPRPYTQRRAPPLPSLASSSLPAGGRAAYLS